MAQSLFSPNWFRVADLKPRVRSHVRAHRHRYRGANWFIVQDEQTGQFHRLSPTANHMIALMDGRRTIADIWAATTEWLGPEGVPPTQDDVIRLLAQMHHADLLAGDIPTDIEELAHRADSRARQSMIARLKNPLALRLPMIDPDRFLEATMPLFRPVFTWMGFIVWLGVVLAGGAIAVLNWGPLTEGLADRVFLADNLVVLILVYPVIKAVHELGHGYAVKNWGGEVHEMGLMFLVLVPVPYVDASASSAFVSKTQRAVVGGAGILVELFVAALAMIVWVNAEPGLVRAAAFNAALIGGVSTLLFNGNPLLRFDGYYVLADLAEIPNLGKRSNAYIFYLVKRYLFGLRGEQSPVTAQGERTWFPVYAVLAFVYRLTIMIGIAIFIAGKLFFVGIALALMAIVTAFVWPVLKGAWWLIQSSDLRGNRRRALTVSAVASAFAAFLIMAVPVPYATSAEGVIWLPEDAVVRAKTEGLLVEIAGDAQAEVGPGDQLARLESRMLRARLALLRAQRQELQLRLSREIVNDRAREAILREQITHADAALLRISERIAGLTATAPRAGKFLTLSADDKPGTLIGQGDLLGYLLAPGDPVVRVVVPEFEADLVRNRLHSVAIVLAHAVHEPIEARIVNSVPKAVVELPSAALGTAGGGAIVLDPTAGNSETALQPVFQFDLAVDLPAGDVLIGQRAYVRFDHGAEPIGVRLYRGVRQLFLSRFDV